MALNRRNEKVLLFVKRDEHYEVHFDDRVEFWSLDMGTKQGWSKVEKVE